MDCRRNQEEDTMRNDLSPLDLSATQYGLLFLNETALIAVPSHWYVKTGDKLRAQYAFSEFVVVVTATTPLVPKYTTLSLEKEQ